MKNKRIKDLENRVTQLEREFNTLYLSLAEEQKDSNNTLSYEEVINLWLNGKEQI